jgi:hypothetical protein
MSSASSSNPIVGLVIPLVLIISAVWAMRRSAKKKPTFNPCPIYNENIQYSVGFQRGMMGHFKAEHPEYRR